MSPAEFAIRNRLISFIVIAAALIGGWQAYGHMARFEDPEFTIRQAVVSTQYPGATPEEVADEVSDPLESAIQQLQEVDEIRSTSLPGASRIDVEIKYEFSPDKEALQGVWTKLRNKVEDARSSLPPGASQPIVNDAFGDVYGLYYLITGPGFTAKELYDYAKRVQTELLATPGVAKVVIDGHQQEAIYVEISRERAAALGIDVEQVYGDLAQQNSIVPAGDLKIGNRRLMIQPGGVIDSVSAIENLIISTPSPETIVYLRDVATVQRGYQEPPESLVRYKGEPAIGLGVSSVTGANVVKMGEAIEAKLRDELDRRPLGIEIHEFYHQGKTVDTAVQDFAVNVLLALLIVLVTLMIFMGLRSATVIGAVLILTIGATLTTMDLVDIPLHRISLGALIIALGMLVDNAIVVTEGILVGVQSGRSKLDAAKEIVGRTKWPLLGGTIVGIIAFAPIGLAEGDTAEYTGHLFWVVLISLLFSWLFAITAAPLLADLLFEESSGASETRSEGRFIRNYKAFIRIVLKARWAVVATAVAVFMTAMWAFQFVKPGFFPASTTPQIVVDYWLPEGTDISQTRADMIEIEASVGALDGVKNVHTLIGEGGLRYMLVYAPEPSSSSYGQLLVVVDDYNLIEGLIPRIQKLLDSGYPDAQAKVWQFQLGPGGGSKIEAAFSGPDPVVLRDLANQATAIMATDAGAISIQDDWRQQVPVIQPLYSESRGRRLGISREDLAEALRRNSSGSSVGVYREGDELIPIIARAPARERVDASQMGSILINSPATGRSVPLSETVDGFETVWRNAQLRKVDRVYTIKAQCDPLPDELPSTLLARIRPAVEGIELPAGYALEWEGEYGDSKEANGSLASTLPLGFLAMVLVVVILFNQLRQPLVIWLVVPLALIGVVIGLLVTNTALEFMAILGLLSLSGLLIKNAIVLVDQMDVEIRAGKPRHDAVVDSAASRVRPVTMGALTTVLGVMPLFTDAFFESMAVVLVFGLTFATLLTLIIVPALYAIFFRIRSDEVATGQVVPE